MKNFFGWLKKKLLHNWGLKIASIFLAFVIWFIVAQVGDPKDTRSFDNIRVKLVNTDLLTDQNKYFAVVDGTDIVRVSVTAPTSVFQTLRASDIEAEADVSKLTDINTIAISYRALNVNADAISFDGDRDVVQLDVENKTSKWIRVQYQTVGTLAEGYVIGNTNADQTSINITGPESSVNQVASAYAELNVEGATNTSSANCEIVLRDRENNILNLNNIEMSADYVWLSAEVLATKEIPINVEYSGTPADGYMVVGKPQQDIEKILVAGSVAALARVNRISIPAEKVDVTGATDDVVISLYLKDYLPDNVKIGDPESNGRVAVTVTIKPSRERNMEIPPQNISFTNVPEGYVVSLPEEEENRTPVSIRVFGLRETVNALRANAITGSIDVLAWMNQNGITELVPGAYDIPVNFNIGNDLTILESGSIRVVITAVE
ncbi:MAG: hypothetical protein J6Z22_10095 [Lachnospiraceae bacterium]|nr:hypothetical protein [Lachnospiraceae bacterium]